MPVYKNISNHEVLLNREPNQSSILLKPGQTVTTFAYYDDKPELQKLDDKPAVPAAVFSQKITIYSGSNAQVNVFLYDLILIHVSDYTELRCNDETSTPLILPPNSTFTLQNYQKLFSTLYLSPAEGISQVTVVVNCPHRYVDAQYWR